MGRSEIRLGRGRHPHSTLMFVICSLHVSVATQEKIYINIHNRANVKFYRAVEERRGRREKTQ